jgi:hypothetical protein
MRRERRICCWRGQRGICSKTAFDELAEVAEALRPASNYFVPVENATKQWAEINGWLKELQARLGRKESKRKFSRFRRFDSRLLVPASPFR